MDLSNIIATVGHVDLCVDTYALGKYKRNDFEAIAKAEIEHEEV